MERFLIRMEFDVSPAHQQFRKFNGRGVVILMPSSSLKGGALHLGSELDTGNIKMMDCQVGKLEPCKSRMTQNQQAEAY